MFTLSLRPLFTTSVRIGLIPTQINTYLSTVPKFLRNVQQKKESKWQSIQELVLKKNRETNGKIDWNELVVELVEQRLVYKQNFEMDLMSAFLLNEGTDCRKLDEKLFKSMTAFVRHLPNIVSNSIAISKYCHFVSHFSHLIDNSDIDLIRRTSDELADRYAQNKIADYVFINSIIGLTQSSKDNCLHSMQLLGRLKSITPNLIERIIDSSIKFKLFEQSFELMNRYLDLSLDKDIISKAIDALIDSNLSFDKTIQLFRSFSKNLIVFDIELKPKFIKILNRFSYKSIDTYIARNGLCLKCEQTLKGLSAKENKCLVEEFKSVAFDMENDPQMASFPEFKKELNNFNHFYRKVTANKPLDLVIDGLNIAFSTYAEIVEDETKLRKFVQKYKTENIDRNAVEILVRNEVLDKYENILLIGRRHMRSWKTLNQLLTTRSDRIKMFYAMNKTADDCYVLYAAIASNTPVISNDFYRDFCDKMSQKSSLFQRWLKTHQILIQNKKLFQFPDQFDHKIHISFDNRIIHIPFSSGDDMKVKWICSQRLD